VLSFRVRDLSALMGIGWSTADWGNIVHPGIRLSLVKSATTSPTDAQKG
jgi:hypothetical protein